jgi:hypothetical protein
MKNEVVTRKQFQQSVTLAKNPGGGRRGAGRGERGTTTAWVKYLKHLQLDQTINLLKSLPSQGTLNCPCFKPTKGAVLKTFLNLRNFLQMCPTAQ